MEGCRLGIVGGCLGICDCVGVMRVVAYGGDGRGRGSCECI